MQDARVVSSSARSGKLARFATLLASSLAVIVLTGCGSSVRKPVAPPPPVLCDTTYRSFDGERLPYRKWRPPSHRDPELVVIAFHGIAGHSGDFRVLGEHLQSPASRFAVYAPDLRGQGNDPKKCRQGDIPDRREWFDDAYTFTRLVRDRHPHARVVWLGESMGSLIALHAYATAAQADAPPPADALILSSPIAAIRDLTGWQRIAIRWGAALFPKLRLSLETLAGEDEVEVIKGVSHQEQVDSNPYHISSFTLRLLYTVGDMIEQIQEQAALIDVPVLLLHGGHDIFSRPADVGTLEEAFPARSRVERAFFPESYHLLFYDHEREKVLAEVERWLRALPNR